MVYFGDRLPEGVKISFRIAGYYSRSAGAEPVDVFLLECQTKDMNG